jgi:hypothetical protein
MGTHIEEDIKLQYKNERDILYKELDFRDFRDILGHLLDPVKREAPDVFRRGYQEVILPQLQQVAHHIEAIEKHLESDAIAKGKAFVRPEERPAVGKEMLNEVLEPLKLLSERLDRVEQKLTKTVPVKAA